MNSKLLGEHILYSIAVALIIGTLWEIKFKYTLPIWIIAACAWLPDIDYVLQSITFPFCNITHFCIIHGDYHNVFVLLTFSYIIAYLLKKYYDMNFNNVFLCVTIGWIIHLMCDFFVYDYASQPFYPIHCVIWSCQLIPEFGSFYGIGELSIIMWGFLIVGAALILQSLYTENNHLLDLFKFSKDGI